MSIGRILLTGKNGQVGWELQRTLAMLGKIVATDFPDLDFANSDAIRGFVREVKPTVIVNAAAYTAVDKAESEPDVAMAINGLAPGILAEEAKRLNALLIHYSTDYVFDGMNSEPYTEEDKPNPLSIYGKTKLAGDRAIQEVGGAHLILRTSWVYGVRGKNFLLTMLRLAKERDEIRVVDDQIGAPTWSRLIADATALVIAKFSFPSGKKWGEGIFGTYNLTAAGSTSWYGFAQVIFARAASAGLCALPILVPIPTEAYPLLAPRPRNSRLSSEKLHRTFGIAPPSWEDALTVCMREL